jgi:hypothetical protein
MIQKSKIQMAKGLCLFAGVALGAAVLTGCSSEDISSRAQGDGHPKVQVTATVLSADPQTATRADDGLNIASTGFSDNTKTVYIGVNKGSAGADTWQGYEFGISGTGNSQTLTAPASGPEFPSGVTSVSVYGWYPYNNGNKTFTVLADQSTNANYNASDLMLANSATCSHDGSSVTAADLTFRHALTKMKVTVTPATGVTINSIKLKSMKPQVTIDDDDKAALTVGSADGEATDITLFSGESTAAVTQCAVFPGQEKAAGALLVVNASAGGGAATDVTYSLDGAKTFTADKQYVMNIALNATAVAAGSVTLTDWETASGTVTVNAGGGGLELQTSSSGSNGYVMFGTVSAQPWTGSEIRPKPTVQTKINGTTITLVEGTDFDFSYANNINAGASTATLTVTGKGMFSGSVSQNFSIVSFVELSAVTESHVGKPVGANGRVYGDLSQLTAASTTCVGVLAYSGSTGHGYIIALQNSANANCSTVNGYTAYSGSIASASGSKLVPSGSYNGLSSYTTLGSTAVSNWVVLTKDQYTNMWNQFGGATKGTYNSTSNGYITAAGGAALSSKFYSCTPYSPGYGWGYNSNGWDSTGGEYGVRPVLAF